MRRLLVSIAASAMLAVALVGPAAAAEPHRSCAAFGALTAAIAPGGALGAMISSVAPGNPGLVAGIVAGEHDEFCAAPQHVGPRGRR